MGVSEMMAVGMAPGPLGLHMAYGLAWKVWRRWEKHGTTGIVVLGLFQPVEYLFLERIDEIT